jgi:hypothetical protein
MLAVVPVSLLAHKLIGHHIYIDSMKLKVQGLNGL